MEIKNAIIELRQYWDSRNIKSTGQSFESISAFEKKKGIKLPKDFVEYFENLNGMEFLYPNESDDNGFLFYPLSQLKYTDEESVKKIERKENLLIFIDYMQHSWSYGLRILGNDSYEIGIMPDLDKFKPITRSLTEFVIMYIQDNEIIYNYE